MATRERGDPVRRVEDGGDPDHPGLLLQQRPLVCLCRFGLPFVLYMDRTVTWDALQKEILEKMRHLLRPGVYIQVGEAARALKRSFAEVCAKDA